MYFQYMMLLSLHLDMLGMKSHLKVVRPKLKTIYSKVNNIYEFFEIQYNLLMPVCMWINDVNFLMYGRY
jgi:hypothetical protein